MNPPIALATKRMYPIKPDHIIVMMEKNAAGQIKYHWQFKTSNLKQPDTLIELTLDLLLKQFGSNFLQGLKGWTEKKATTSLIENLQRQYPDIFRGTFNPAGFG